MRFQGHFSVRLTGQAIKRPPRREPVIRQHAVGVSNQAAGKRPIRVSEKRAAVHLIAELLAEVADLRNAAQAAAIAGFAQGRLLQHYGWDHLPAHPVFSLIKRGPIARAQPATGAIGKHVDPHVGFRPKAAVGGGQLPARS